MIFLWIGIVLQGVIFAITKEKTLSFISGLTGVCSVVLCSQRKIAYYLFGFAQIITYSFILLQQSLYAQLLVQLFYIVTMIVGLILWMSHYNAEEDAVMARSLSSTGWLVSQLTLWGGLAITYLILRKTNDTQPLLDAAASVPAVIAQILMIARFKEQWIYWLIVEIVNLFVWLKVSDWSMVSMYTFWIVTCVYGYIKWSK